MRYFNGRHLFSHGASLTEQLHLVQDFTVETHDPSQYRLSANVFTVVTVLLVRYEDRDTIVTCCNLCSGTSNPNMFLGVDWSKTLSALSSLKQFLGCRHSAVVLGALAHKHRIHYSNLNSLHDSLITCLNEIPLPNETLKRGSWYILPEEITSDKGTWAVYVTEECTMLLLAISKATTIKGQKFYCFRCPRAYPSCHHVRNIAFECPLAVEARVFQQRNPTQPLSGMVSKQRYPCNIISNSVKPTMDDGLTQCLNKRSTLGASWYLENIPDFSFVPPETKCSNCDQVMQPVCLTRQATVFSAPMFLSNFKVFKRQCVKCQQELFYDGREYGLANYQNLMIFPIELLYEALEIKTHSGIPTLSWWRGKVEIACFGVNTKARHFSCFGIHHNGSF